MGRITHNMMHMITRETAQPEAKKALPKKRESVGRRLARRKVLGALRDGVNRPKLMEFEPQGEESKRLNSHIATLEPRLRDLAITEPDTKAVIGETDKGRQNAMNKLAGMEGGDRIIEAYWDKIGLAVGAVARANGCNGVGIHLIRVAPRSDEGITINAGRRLSGQTRLEFDEAMKAANDYINLGDYEYTVTIGDEVFKLNLEAFSRVLKYGRDMVTACNYSLSEPITISPDGRAGFIQEEIRRLENQEVSFYDFLPTSFQGIGGLAEVKSPFTSNLMDSGVEKLSGGVFIEIKLGMQPADAEGLLRFTEDGWGQRFGIGDAQGTRKGFAEVFMGEIGMRGLNTFIGKARTNRVLTAITQSMGDVSSQLGTAVMPVSGGYLTYWVDASFGSDTAEAIANAIGSRIHSTADNGIDLDLNFEPSVRMIGAAGMDIEDIRARFILKSLGKDLYPTAVLDKTDFLLNFIENIRTDVQMQIYEELAMEGKAGLHNLDNINLLRRVCSKKAGGRRTIRDTEDLVWTLRNDERLPTEIRSRKEELERWLFDFSWEEAGGMFQLLARRIQAVANSLESHIEHGRLRVVG
jgi:hypothetical protein